MPYKQHKRGDALHETHPSGGKSGNSHREPHPSGKTKKVHNHRMTSGGGEITEYVKKVR